MEQNREPLGAKRFQGWIALLTSMVLLGVLATGVIIAIVRLIQWFLHLVS
jgi:hypothetical protein